MTIEYGYSNISISGDYLYTMGYNKDTMSNILYCISVATGETVWQYSFKASKGKYEGPKSTPVIDEGLVYTFSQDGDFLCHDAATGALQWERQGAKSMTELHKGEISFTQFLRPNNRKVYFH